jgi:RNA polymerase sigma-70 factor (ECF subfamily)
VISDEDLMGSAEQGDTGAFEQIVLRYQASVWRVACRFTGNAADAQDITQIVFLKLFEAAPRYRPTALLKTYLFRIVNSTCIDHSRKKRTLTLEERIDIPDESPSVEDDLINNEKSRALRDAINTLSLRHRSVIVLRYDAELSVRDIAGILKITEKATERLLARARGALHLSLKNKINRGG